MFTIANDQASLFRAITLDKLEIIEKLLVNGAVSITEPGPNGVTPIKLAEQLGEYDVLRLFLNKFDVTKINILDASHIELLLIASRIGHANFIERWMQYGLPFIISNFDGDTPFHLAATSFCPEKTSSMLALLHPYADPNVQNKEGKTPLHHLVSSYEEREDLDACEQAQEISKMICFLTTAGIDVNGRDSMGRSPLILAKIGKMFDCFFDLLRFGADVNVEDNEGLTVFHHIFRTMNQNCCFDLDEPREMMQIEREYYEPVLILIHHVIRMVEIGLPLNQKIKDLFIHFILWLDFFREDIQLSEKYVKIDKLSTRNMVGFSRLCRVELLKLYRIKLADLSMFEMIRASDYVMSKLVMNKDVKEYFEEPGRCQIDFPNFHFLLDQRYNAGIVRNILLPVNTHKIWPDFPITPDTELALQHYSNSRVFENIRLRLSLNPFIQCSRTLAHILLYANKFYSYKVNLILP